MHSQKQSVHCAVDVAAQVVPFTEKSVLIKTQKKMNIGRNLTEMMIYSGVSNVEPTHPPLKTNISAERAEDAVKCRTNRPTTTTKYMFCYFHCWTCWRCCKKWAYFCLLLLIKCEFFNWVSQWIRGWPLTSAGGTTNLKRFYAYTHSIVYHELLLIAG